MKKVLILSVCAVSFMVSAMALEIGSVLGIPAIGWDLGNNLTVQALGNIEMRSGDAKGTAIVLGARGAYGMMKAGAISMGAFGSFTIGSYDSDYTGGTSSSGASGINLGATMMVKFTEKVSLITDIPFLSVINSSSAGRSTSYSSLGLGSARIGILYNI